MSRNLNDIEKLIPLEPNPWLFEKIQQRILEVQEEYLTPKQVKWAFLALATILLVNISLTFFMPESKSIVDAFELNDSSNTLYP